MADPDGGPGGSGGRCEKVPLFRRMETYSGFSLALVQRMLLILLVAPVTTAPQSNEALYLAYVKTDLRSTIGDGRLNYLIMLHINKDTQLDYTAMTDRYAGKRAR